MWTLFKNMALYDNDINNNINLKLKLCLFENVFDIKKVKSAGICTVKGIQMMTLNRMGAIKVMNYAFI